MSKEIKRSSSWRTLETTFNQGPAIKLAKRIRLNKNSRSPKINKTTPRSHRRKTINTTLSSPKSTQCPNSDEVFVEDSDCENQSILQSPPSQITKRLNNIKSNPRPFSNISNSPRIPKEHSENDDEDEIVNFDPDTEPFPCNNCLESSSIRKSPVAVLTFFQTKRPASRTRTYSDDIFLEASIESQSPAPIEVPETDSCSSSQAVNEEKLEDLIDSDESLKSNNRSLSRDLTLIPNAHNFTIDESTNDSAKTIIPSEEASQQIPSTLPGTSSSFALADTIVVESSSSNSQHLSHPLLPVNPKVKRLRAKKNGFLDALNAAVNKSKSNFAFWHQERRSSLMGNGGTCFEVMKVDRTFGRCLIFARNVEEYLVRCDNTKRIGFLVDSDMKICAKIKVGAVLEVDLSRESEGFAVSDADDRQMLVYAGVQYIRIV